MSKQQIETLLSNFNDLAMFKEYMESIHCSEVVTSFLWITKISQLVGQERYHEFVKFCKEFIFDKAPRPLNVCSDIVSEISLLGPGIQQYTFNALHEELENAFHNAWLNFCTSPIYKRFRNGEYEPRIVRNESRWRRSKKKERRESFPQNYGLGAPK
jgi:hypothetical protein